MGLSFKADTDDLRESPVVEVVLSVAEMSLGILLVVEPHIQLLPEVLDNREGIELSSIEQALSKADIVVLLVGHKEFEALDQELLLNSKIIDVCGLWSRFSIHL